jgi:hypothetical protein
MICGLLEGLDGINLVRHRSQPFQALSGGLAGRFLLDILQCRFLPSGGPVTKN